MSTGSDVDRSLIDALRPAVTRHALRTPLLPSPWLSDLAGVPVFLKAESLQLTGSFKLRGALAAIAFLGESANQGVVTSSAGNHGLGLAWAARELAVPCTVVVPNGAPKVKTEAIAALGARLVVAPCSGYDATERWMRERLDELGGHFVSAFDHPAVIAGGGGSLGLEILEQDEEVNTLVIPCGGGGCVAGVGIAARSLTADRRVVAVNVEASPALARSLEDGRPHLELETRPTLADGLEGGIGALAFELCREVVDEVVLVGEDSLRHAIRGLARHHGLIVEGSAAVGVAALLASKLEHLDPETRIAILLSGRNIDADRLAPILSENRS